MLQEVITLESAAVKEATASILEMHSIPATTSKDMMEASSSADSQSAGTDSSHAPAEGKAEGHSA